MMTQNVNKKREQIHMFYMDEMTPSNYLFRIIDQAIEWSFIYELVEDKYSQDTGRLSMDPVTLIKISLIQYQITFVGLSAKIMRRQHDD